jgi:glutathione-regulated potassium-efflux system protein KefB
MRGNIATTQPAPLVVPRREGKALNEEAAEAIGEAD